MEHRTVADYTNVNVGNGNVKVYVRLRPPGDGSNAVDPRFLEKCEDTKKIVLRDPGHHSGDYAFLFDKIFWIDTSQEEMFTHICKPQIDHVLRGFNACSFAYGQTGSGKTHIMFGTNDGDQRGLIPRAIEELFGALEHRKSNSKKETAMVVSFLEIYLDQVRDLGKAYLTTSSEEIGERPSQSETLSRKTSDIFSRLELARMESFARTRSSETPHNSHRGNVTPLGNRGGATLKDTRSIPVTGGGGQTILSRTGSFMEPVYRDDHDAMNLEIHEDGEGNVFVKDLSLIPVTSIKEALNVLNKGLHLRATHETKMNHVSSRSHTVFTITVVQKNPHTKESISGTLHLVDLAGSERLKKSESQGRRMREAVHINSSLTALGKVVMALDPSCEKTHVPYRDAKLTRILQNSLGGNSYMAVVTTIHPLHEYSEECLSSLQFANRCRNVQNNPRVNYIGNAPEDKDRKIKRLTEEVVLLTKKLNNKGYGDNERVLTVLQALGVQGTMHENGTIELGDGRKIDTEGLLAGGVGSSLPPFVGGIDEGSCGLGGGGGGMGGGPALSSEQLNKLSESLKAEVKTLTNKVKKKKEQVEGLQKELSAVRKSKLDMESDLRESKKDLQVKLDKESRYLRDYATIMTNSHKAETEKLVADNKVVLKEQYDYIMKIPPCRRGDRGSIDPAENEKRARTNEANEQWIIEQIKIVEQGKDAQMTNLQQQYEYWLEKRDQELINFVKDFNTYRERKRSEAKAQSEELLVLFDYTYQLMKIVDKVEHGMYQIRKDVNGRPKVDIPLADKPAKELLADNKALPATRKALHRRQKETLAMQQIKKNATSVFGQLMGKDEMSAEEEMASILRAYHPKPGATSSAAKALRRPSSAHATSRRADHNTDARRQDIDANYRKKNRNQSALLHEQLRQKRQNNSNDSSQVSSRLGLRAVSSDDDEEDDEPQNACWRGPGKSVNRVKETYQDYLMGPPSRRKRPQTASAAVRQSKPPRQEKSSSTPSVLPTASSLQEVHKYQSEAKNLRVANEGLLRLVKKLRGRVQLHDGSSKNHSELRASLRTRPTSATVRPKVLF